MSTICGFVGLSMATEIKVGFMAMDEPSSKFLSCIKDIMQFKSIDKPDIRILLTTEQMPNHFSKREKIEEINYKFKYVFSKISRWEVSQFEKDSLIIRLNDQFFTDGSYIKISNFSRLLGFLALDLGGMLIHGALASKNCVGIILAGTSGVGKTTASKRLPLPWQSLSDEATIVIPDSKGIYWAQPLPTSSKFREGIGGTWNVQHAVPLKSIFFLYQSENDRAKPLNRADSIRLLITYSWQTMILILDEIDQEWRHAMLSKLFDNASALFSTISGFELYISKTGRFWEELDQVLGSKNEIRAREIA
jgi:SynChlorMet cassette protein ScmC